MHFRKDKSQSTKLSTISDSATTLVSEFYLQDKHNQSDKKNDIQTEISSILNDEDTGSKATDFEHSLTTFRALGLYKKAVFWSVVVSLILIMDGYDGTLTGGLLAQKAFQEAYGERLPSGNYNISTAWQLTVGLVICVSRIIGALGVGFFISKWGCKKTLICSLFFVIAFLFIEFFAQNMGTLTIGAALTNIIWGGFNTLASTYASEVCPVALRGILTSYINLAWGIGQLISQCVLNGFVESSSHWSYRIPFAIQWVWPVLLLVLLPFAPESPWWLVRRDRLGDARKALEKLTSFKESESYLIDNQLSMIIETDRKERENNTEEVGWKDCFKGIDARRTEIGCMAWVVQAFSGDNLTGYAAYFFELAGLDKNQSFKLALGLAVISVVGTIISWSFTDRFGRRSTYLVGISFIVIFLFLMGIFDFPKKGPNFQTFAWIQSILLLLISLTFNLTLGPVALIVVSEVSAIRLREKSIALAMSSYAVCSLVLQVVVPLMINPGAGNWSGKIGFFFGGLSVISFIWTYFRLPEMSGRTFAEIDHMFELKLPARAFKKYKFEHEKEVKNQLDDVSD